MYVSCYSEVVGSYRGEGRRVFMDFHFFSFGGQFRVFGDCVCVKENRWCLWRTYHISLSFSFFCISEREREKEEYVLVRKREKSQLRNDWDSS